MKNPYLGNKMNYIVSKKFYFYFLANAIAFAQQKSLEFKTF